MRLLKRQQDMEQRSLASHVDQKVLYFMMEQFYTQGICKVDVVDAMGAGDAFIAAFLRHYADNKDMKEALSYAAERAAYACTYAGGFGHPHKA